MADFRFYHPLEIRYSDLDPQDHVNNARYLNFFEQARIHYLVQLGLFAKGQSFMEIGIILADAHITFKAPLNFGTEVKVGMRVSRLGNKSMDSEYVVVNAENGEEYARGTSVLVAYDYRTRNTIPIPQEWREKIGRFEGIV